MARQAREMEVEVWTEYCIDSDCLDQSPYVQDLSIAIRCLYINENMYLAWMFDNGLSRLKLLAFVPAKRKLFVLLVLIWFCQSVHVLLDSLLRAI